MDTEAFLKAQLARPLTHRVTIHYEGGATRTHDTRSEAQAENYAVGERRKIGRSLTDRMTGDTVRVSGVTITSLS